MEERFEKQMQEAIACFKLPEYDTIPDVGLFLEQTTKYISGVLAPLSGVTITGSMIANYVKKKLIDNPVKKQYSREQIAYLIFVAIAKSVLSLEDLQVLIEMQRRTYPAKVAYIYFCKEFEKLLFYTYGISSNYEMVWVENSIPKTMLRNTVIAAVNKVYLDHSISLLREEGFSAPKKD